ncbi:hypothetical protein [Escherichia phage vB_EcoM-LTH01]
MRKVYPKKPNATKTPRYGSEECPRITDEESRIVKENFAEIFLFGPTNNDPYTLLAERLGSDRNRAKTVYYAWVYRQKGHYFRHVTRERQVRSRLVCRIKKYTEFLNNPETIYQIMCRAEDEVDELIAKGTIKQ